MEWSWMLFGGGGVIAASVGRRDEAAKERWKRQETEGREKKINRRDNDSGIPCLFVKFEHSIVPGQFASFQFLPDFSLSTYFQSVNAHS